MRACVCADDWFSEGGEQLTIDFRFWYSQFFLLTKTCQQLVALLPPGQTNGWLLYHNLTVGSGKVMVLGWQASVACLLEQCVL